MAESISSGSGAGSIELGFSATRENGKPPSSRSVCIWFARNTRCGPAQKRSSVLLKETARTLQYTVFEASHEICAGVSGACV